VSLGYAAGATAVQIVNGSRRGARTIEHVGSAHDELELEALKAAARGLPGSGLLDRPVVVWLNAERTAALGRTACTV